MRKVSSYSHAQFLSKNKKPINFAYLLHISGPDDYSPRQNRPVYLHFKRKVLSVWLLHWTSQLLPSLLEAGVADVVLKYRTLFRLVACTRTCAVMIVTIVIKCVAFCDTVCRNDTTDQMLSDVNWLQFHLEGCIIPSGFSRCVAYMLNETLPTMPCTIDNFVKF